MVRVSLSRRTHLEMRSDASDMLVNVTTATPCHWVNMRKPGDVLSILVRSIVRSIRQSTWSASSVREQSSSQIRTHTSSMGHPLCNAIEGSIAWHFNQFVSNNLSTGPWECQVPVAYFLSPIVVLAFR